MNSIELAQDVLKKRNLSIPIDIYRLASELGYVVFELPFNKLEGEDQAAESLSFYRKDDLGNKDTIVINEEVNELKKRFILAREIGRIKIFYDRHDTKDIDYYYEYLTKPNDINPEKSEAENFAFSLLMPKEEVLAFYNTLSTPYLAPFIDKFKLPVIIIQDRLDELKLRYIR